MVTEREIEELKNRNERNKETEISLNDGPIDIKIDGEEYKGLTPSEAARRFGTNYYVMQNLRYLFNNNQEIENIIKEEQSVKKQIIDIFIKTLEKNNIFEGILSIEEIRDKLDKTINGAYITNEGYRKKVGGFFQNETKDLYVLSQGNLNPEELKQAVFNGNIEKLIDMDRLGVICHETLHALTDYENGVGFHTNGDSGISINEGVTELFAEQMVPNMYKTYEENVKTAKYLCAILGEDIVKEAYLKGNMEYLIEKAKEKNVTQIIPLIHKSDLRHHLLSKDKYIEMDDIDKRNLRIMNRRNQ